MIISTGTAFTTNTVIFSLLIVLALSLGFFSLFVAVGTYIVKKVWYSGGNSKPQKRQYNHISVKNPRESQHYQEYRRGSDGKYYSPTGWVWNEKTKLWDPPDYLTSASSQIHTDRTGPTYEEWKAAREAEQDKDKSTP